MSSRCDFNRARGEPSCLQGNCHAAQRRPSFRPYASRVSSMESKKCQYNLASAQDKTESGCANSAQDICRSFKKWERQIKKMYSSQTPP
jgi:hypothetical protein